MTGGGIDSRSFIQHCQASSIAYMFAAYKQTGSRAYLLLTAVRPQSLGTASSYFRSAPSPDPLWTDDPRGEGSSPAAEVGQVVRRWRGRAGQDRTAWRLLQCSCLAASPALTGQGQDDTMTVLEVVRMPVPRSMC